MMSSHRSRIRTALMVPMALLPLLGACGGGEEQTSSAAVNSETSGSTGETCSLLFLFVFGDVCVDNSSASSGGAGSTDPLGGPGDIATGSSGSGGVSSGNTRRANVNGFPEFEPNSTIDNANHMPLPVVPEHMSGGVEIVGSVQQDDDPADFFIFTPHRSDTYLVYLCASTCIDIVYDDQVYLMVYDQGQTSVAGTPIGTYTKQQFSVELKAGLAYYVAIHGYDTGAQPYPYKLVVIN